MQYTSGLDLSIKELELFDTWTPTEFIVDSYDFTGEILETKFGNSIDNLIDANTYFDFAATSICP